jgi:hypothetical protein
MVEIVQKLAHTPGWRSQTIKGSSLLENCSDLIIQLNDEQIKCLTQ